MCPHTTHCLCPTDPAVFHTRELIGKQFSGKVDAFPLQRKERGVQRGSFISSFHKYLLDEAEPDTQAGTCPDT